MTISIDSEKATEIETLGLQELENLAAFVLAKMFVHPESEAAISFVDEAQMEQLHLEWMNLPGATDVMSFPMDELTPGTPEALSGPGVLGDVVVCLPVAKTQAQAAGHDLMTEVKVLITHSLLHLLGYDHDNPIAEAEMFSLQAQLLHDFAAESA